MQRPKFSGEAFGNNIYEFLRLNFIFSLSTAAKNHTLILNDYVVWTNVHRDY